LLSNQARKAVISFLDLRRGGAEVKRKVSFPNPLHPSLERSLKIVEGHFSDVMLCDQGLLDDPQTSKILSLVSERIIFMFVSAL
jgi:DNA primase small subunit